MRKGYGVTANLLTDGTVVYLDAQRRWSVVAKDVALVDAAASDALVAWAKTQERDVCGPYAFELSIDDSGGWRTSARERLRARGAADVRARLAVGGPG